MTESERNQRGRWLHCRQIRNVASGTYGGGEYAHRRAKAAVDRVVESIASM